jgi:hypothetical protein
MFSSDYSFFSSCNLIDCPTKGAVNCQAKGTQYDSFSSQRARERIWHQNSQQRSHTEIMPVTCHRFIRNGITKIPKGLFSSGGLAISISSRPMAFRRPVARGVALTGGRADDHSDREPYWIYQLERCEFRAVSEQSDYRACNSIKVHASVINVCKK